jgi:nicotinamide-nucleotide amidase
MRQILTAELLSIGSELTVGETRDTNAGELARSLTDDGVEVLRLMALPDDEAAVRDAWTAGLARADLVVSTGGLGPTPDDLTRESIAATIGETPTIDPELERWLRGLFERRGAAFSATNLKQAWTLPSVTPIPNDNGTAPGWWVDRPDGRIMVALPGPPREMRPMWAGWVHPRLVERGLGRPVATVTLRTAGMGESQMAERLGPLLTRGTNPTIATYARAEAVDVRISAEAGTRDDAAALVHAAEAAVLERIGSHVWGRGDATWASVLAEALAARQWRLATVEVGTHGSLAALLGEGLGARLVRATVDAAGPGRGGGGRVDAVALARSARADTGAEVGLAVVTRARGSDLAVSIAVADPAGEQIERRLAFIAGAMGRTRAATLAAAVLHARLRS